MIFQSKSSFVEDFPIKICISKAFPIKLLFLRRFQSPSRKTHRFQPGGPAQALKTLVAITRSGLLRLEDMLRRSCKALGQLPGRWFHDGSRGWFGDGWTSADFSSGFAVKFAVRDCTWSLAKPSHLLAHKHWSHCRRWRRWEWWTPGTPSAGGKSLVSTADILHFHEFPKTFILKGPKKSQAVATC